MLSRLLWLAPWLASLCCLQHFQWQVPLACAARLLAKRRAVRNGQQAAGSFAGVVVFFDAEHSCPPRFCPTSMEQYDTVCALEGSPTQTHRRAFVKPIVVPLRVHDLGIHTAVAGAAPLARSLNGFGLNELMWRLD